MQRIEKKWPKAQRIHAIESLLSNIVKVVEDCQLCQSFLKIVKDCQNSQKVEEQNCQNSQKVEEQNCPKKSNIDKHCRNSKKWS